ncbi:MAG TPA: FkbM family methyltransferase, partial [Bacteroidia bacterium]|nr:FkbM family methyltransferase [Bacteroidia bacterium]
IGCHHPFYLSNTAFFYENGATGVCVEPDPLLFKVIKEGRKRDVCLNAGIGTSNQNSADFYIISEKTLNTFSKEDAERYVSYGNKKIEQIIQVPLISINEVMEKYFKPYPNMVSLDAEGFDLEILKSMDFKKFRPQVFCIETLTYTENGTEEKIFPIIDFMKQNDYFVYADTYINSIFIDKQTWNNK